MIRRVRSQPPQGQAQATRDTGQISLLILVDALIAIALVAVVASATSVHLVRHRLVAVADSAALDAADQLDPRAYYGSVVPGPVNDGVLALSSAGVREGVQGYLNRSGAGERLWRLAIAEPTGTPDGVTAEVTLSAWARLPFVTSVLGPWAGGIRVTVTSRARAAAVLPG